MRIPHLKYLVVAHYLVQVRSSAFDDFSIPAIRPPNTPDAKIDSTSAACLSTATADSPSANATPPVLTTVETISAQAAVVVLTTTTLSTKVVNAYSSDITSTVISTIVLPAPTTSSSTSTSTSSKSHTTTSSQSSPSKVEDFFGVLTYELGQYVIMYDVTANDTLYKSTSNDAKTPTKFPVELITNKPNVSQRRFEIYKAIDDGSWGPEVKGSTCTRKIVCEIEFQPDPGNQKNRPAFAVWDGEPWFKNIDPENTCHGECKFEDC
ncbi:hypothetical protein I302_103795 [Kwoniella bestiolae CBS 10118]|uniref:Uncharacterized protein n=1 Tax=Kwoniella bestiolae CBS 10118 TaxID=1296100 RepID=A0A1B9G9D9_9TREE|nr:hypothetical protein I302_02498 [Kwoniella bestiolae CBS 10118]OCF27654.1 hypothetical protein I302_02498 [Kwoniella bestiolae CBS 10118]